MVLYSKFPYGSQFSEEKNNLKIRYLVFEISSKIGVSIFLGHPVCSQKYVNILRICWYSKIMLISPEYVNIPRACWYPKSMLRSPEYVDIPKACWYPKIMLISPECRISNVRQNVCVCYWHTKYIKNTGLPLTVYWTFDLIVFIIGTVHHWSMEMKYFVIKNWKNSCFLAT